VILWIDIHLPPALIPWLATRFNLKAIAMRDQGMQRMADVDIFQRAREAEATIITKDKDFVDLVQRLGPPPKVIRLTMGNTSNENLQRVLAITLPDALRLLDDGEAFIEIGKSV